MKGTYGHRHHTTRPPAPPRAGILTRAHWFENTCRHTHAHLHTHLHPHTHTFSFTGAHKHKDTLLCVHIHKLNKGLCLTCDEFRLFSFFV